jgi:hypothetical protein
LSSTFRLTSLLRIFWLKNRKPSEWRDVQNVEHAVGRYIISDRPMTEEEWIRERATIVDAEATEIDPQLPMLFPTGNLTSNKGRIRE